MTGGKDLSFGQRLRLERESHHWTQEQLAEKIDVRVLTINRWEHGRSEPRPDALERLIEVFGKPPERWGTGSSGWWNVPYPRNLYFTGREQLLQRLHKALLADSSVDSKHLRAISGMGGMGKTQTAIEYAYRYANEYDAILWVQAHSREIMNSDFANLAQTLDLPKKGELNLSQAREAVKRWLEEHDRWLLIFDNVDNLSIVFDFLPRLFSGAILLTTRSPDTGSYIRSVEIEKMSQSEGVTFLLRRIASGGEEDGEEDLSKRVSNVEYQAAQQLWEGMDGLPLALDQAGAYIKMAQCSLTEYVNLYRHHPQDLLRERGEHIPEEHPDAVATTWEVSFQRIEQRNPAAAELLRLSAFLAPDAIPEELLTWGAVHLTSPLQALAASGKLLKDAIKTLRAYSLAQRDPATRMLSIHRLVQAVLIDAMSAETRQAWKERVVCVLNAAFPEIAAPSQEWARCGQLLPHVLACTTEIEHEPVPTQLEASALFDKAGCYLREQGQYAEAELLLKQALSLREQHLDAEHLDIATSLSSLAGLYSYQGLYQQAEPLIKRGYAIRQQRLGAEHPDTAKSLNHLAVLYLWQQQYKQAEPLFEQALSINEQHQGAEHPDTVKIRGNLAVLYLEQGKYEQAEPLFEQALSINTQSLGAEHYETARIMENLAFVYLKQGRYEQAEPLFQRALSIHEQNLGTKSPDTAYPLYGLAELYRHQKKYEQAELLYQRALAIREQHLGEHLDTAEALQGLADLYQDWGKYEDAMPFYEQALAIRGKILGWEHLSTQIICQSYTTLLQTMGRDEEAKKLEGPGETHPAGGHLEAMGRDTEAKKLEEEL